MIRTIITPSQQQISIQIPQDFVGKKVEVIAFTADEAIDESPKSLKPRTHFASETILSKEWLSPEEDTAWSTL